jgi:hypothetical protein
MDLVVWRRGGTIGGVAFDEVAVPMPGQREIWVQGHALGEYVLEAHDRGSEGEKARLSGSYPRASLESEASILRSASQRWRRRQSSWE